MSVTIESLEARSLFSSTDIAAVTADYQTVVTDATVLKSVVATAYTAYKTDLKTITADIKALPKSKTNTADVAALKKALTAAGALDTRDGAKVIAVGKASLNKAKAAFLADVKKPTTANTAKLDAALATLSAVLAAPEAKLAADAGAGNTDIAVALTAVVAANPGAASLSNDVTIAETQGNSSLDSIATEVSTLNADLATLVDAIG